MFKNFIPIIVETRPLQGGQRRQQVNPEHNPFQKRKQQQGSNSNKNKRVECHEHAENRLKDFNEFSNTMLDLLDAGYTFEIENSAKMQSGIGNQAQGLDAAHTIAPNVILKNVPRNAKLSRSAVENFLKNRLSVTDLYSAEFNRHGADKVFDQSQAVFLKLAANNLFDEKRNLSLSAAQQKIKQSVNSVDKIGKEQKAEIIKVLNNKLVKRSQQANGVNYVGLSRRQMKGIFKDIVSPQLDDMEKKALGKSDSKSKRRVENVREFKKVLK